MDDSEEKGVGRNLSASLGTMKITLGKNVQMDLDKAIESKILIQANSGGGKSYTIRRFIEQAFGKKQIIVLDIEGEFANMRSQFDFVYAGPGGDAPVESRSAALLARRLLELKASAIIDLYELPPQERKHFVKLFLESMVNAPKELWHDCFVILDEAHVFAPEKDQAESLGAVSDMASRGRKRGYCLVVATQRPAKLNKDVAAECNNKLIGRASLDIDQERSAKELGFRSKEDILSLRDLEPGEFYAFGPAIGREVVKTTIGEVEVKPPKRGVARGHVPAPSAKVKAILKGLADLPKEAQKEAQTVAELKAEIVTLKRHKCPVVAENPAMGVSQWREYGKERGYWDYFEGQMRESFGKQIKPIRETIDKIYNLAKDAMENTAHPLFVVPSAPIAAKKGTYEEAAESGRVMMKSIPVAAPGTVLVRDEAKFGKGEKIVLGAIASYEDGMTREHITVQTSYKRSTRDAYIQRLIQNGYAELKDDKIRVTFAGAEALGSDYKPLPTGQELVDHHLRTLPQGESAILKLLVEERRAMSRDELTERTNYQRSTRDAYIQRLSARQLVVVSSAGISASSFLI